MRRFRAKASKTHPLYVIWSCMVARCHNPRHPNYPTYGARGIQVCERWRGSLDAFAQDMGPRPAGYTIDRIDNARGYSPDNCRWASRCEQGQNRRDVRTVTHNGVTKSTAAWARDFQIDSSTLNSRLQRGLTLMEAVSRPVDSRFNPRRSPVAL